MGSNSSSVDQNTTTNTTNVLDRRATLQTGLQILDSAISSVDDKVIRETLSGLRANFQVMLSGQTATQGSALSMVETVLGYAAKSQVKLDNLSERTLQIWQVQIKEQMAQGKMVFAFADATNARAMKLAESATDSNSRGMETALKLLGEAKTGDFSDNLKSISAMVMAFAAFVIWQAKRG